MAKKNREQVEFEKMMADKARAMHRRMAEAGHPVTPEEAKFLLALGFAATAKVVGLEEKNPEGFAGLMDTVNRLADDCPKVGDKLAAHERANALALHHAC